VYGVLRTRRWGSPPFFFPLLFPFVPLHYIYWMLTHPEPCFFPPFFFHPFFLSMSKGRRPTSLPFSLFFFFSLIFSPPSPPSFFRDRIGIILGGFPSFFFVFPSSFSPSQREMDWSFAGSFSLFFFSLFSLSLFPPPSPPQYRRG